MRCFCLPKPLTPRYASSAHTLLPSEGLVRVLQNGPYDFSNARAAMVSPLAKRLFGIDGVTGTQEG